jgi:hypothetical protein
MKSRAAWEQRRQQTVAGLDAALASALAGAPSMVEKFRRLTRRGSRGPEMSSERRQSSSCLLSSSASAVLRFSCRARFPRQRKRAAACHRDACRHSSRFRSSQTSSNTKASRLHHLGNGGDEFIKEHRDDNIHEDHADNEHVGYEKELSEDMRHLHLLCVFRLSRAAAPLRNDMRYSMRVQQASKQRARGRRRCATSRGKGGGDLGHEHEAARDAR